MYETNHCLLYVLGITSKIVLKDLHRANDDANASNRSQAVFKMLFLSYFIKSRCFCYQKSYCMYFQFVDVSSAS